MEEDIKILENFIEECNKNPMIEIALKPNGFTKIAIENILERVKLLEQGINPSYEKTIMELEKQLFDNVSKSKIKEEIQPVIDNLEKDGFVGYADEMKDILQNLIN